SRGGVPLRRSCSPPVAATGHHAITLITRTTGVTTTGDGQRRSVPKDPSRTRTSWDFLPEAENNPLGTFVTIALRTKFFPSPPARVAPPQQTTSLSGPSTRSHYEHSFFRPVHHESMTIHLVDPDLPGTSRRLAG